MQKISRSVDKKERNQQLKKDRKMAQVPSAADPNRYIFCCHAFLFPNMIIISLATHLCIVDIWVNRIYEAASL